MTIKAKEVIVLKEAVGYQEGSTVSKEVIKRNTGTVTLFAFDKGQGLSEHTAPFDAFLCILEGGADVVISGKQFNLRAGEMIILPADEPHSLNASERFKMMLVMIKS